MEILNLTCFFYGMYYRAKQTHRTNNSLCIAHFWRWFIPSKPNWHIFEPRRKLEKNWHARREPTVHPPCKKTPDPESNPCTSWYLLILCYHGSLTLIWVCYWILVNLDLNSVELNLTRYFGRQIGFQKACYSTLP